MELTLHKLAEGFVITSDERLDVGVKSLNVAHQVIVKPTDEEWANSNLNNLRKVIAQQHQIDFSALSEEEQKEIGWFDVAPFVNKHFEKYWDKEDGTKMTRDEITPEMMTSLLVEQASYVAGFQKVQELLSDRVFTGKNIVEAIAFGFSICKQFDRAPFDKEQIEFIRSLSKSWKIEVEMNNYDGKIVSTIPKLTNGKIKITKIWN